MLYTAGIQCATFHQFSTSVAARETNSKIEGTNKDSSPDLHYLAMPTVAQAFVVGHTNLQVLFEHTAYVGTYGCAYDTGAIAAVGINGRAVVSDQRNGAFALMPQEQVDELCARLGERAAVRCDDGTFVSAPVAHFGGLPRAMFPGVHAGLAGLQAAFDVLEALSTPQGAPRDVRHSIQVLPFSPFTQAVPPHVVAEPSGMNFVETARGADGRGTADPCGANEFPRPLRTLRVDSLLNSPLYQPATLRILCSKSDNPFETIEPAIASVVLLASVLARLKPLLGGSMATLRERLRSFFLDGRPLTSQSETSAVVDALVLLNCMFPLNFDVGENCLLSGLEMAPHASLTQPTVTTYGALDLGEAYTEEDGGGSVVLPEGHRRRWCVARHLRVCRHGRAQRATFANTHATVKRCAKLTADLGRAVWKVHSNDGVLPPDSWSPLSCRASPEAVQGLDLCVVWTDRPHVAQLNRRKQRGALLGLPNAGPQQVLMLLTGAFLPGVKVQYARNEGNMCLRLSSCALKDAEDGGKLSAKSTSPVYSDADAESFGTIASKQESAKRQQKAWKSNNELIFNVATQFAPPRAKDLRGLSTSRAAAAGRRGVESRGQGIQPAGCGRKRVCESCMSFN